MRWCNLCCSLWWEPAPRGCCRKEGRRGSGFCPSSPAAGRCSIPLRDASWECSRIPSEALPAPCAAPAAYTAINKPVEQVISILEKLQNLATKSIWKGFVMRRNAFRTVSFYLCSCFHFCPKGMWFPVTVLRGVAAGCTTFLMRKDMKPGGDRTEE